MPNQIQDIRYNSTMGPDHSAIVLSNVEGDSTVHNGSDLVGETLLQRLSDPALPERSRRNITIIRQRFAELTGVVVEGVATAQGISDGEASRPLSTLLYGPRSRESNDARRAFVTSTLLRNQQTSATDTSATLARRMESRASGSRDALANRVRDVLDESSSAVTALNRQREQLLDTSRSFNVTVSPPQRDSEASSNSTSFPMAEHQPSDTPVARPWVGRDRTAIWRENLQEHRPIPVLPSSSRTNNDRSRLRSLITLPPLPSAPLRRADTDQYNRAPLPDDLMDMPGLEAGTETNRLERMRRISEITRENTRPTIITDSSDDDDAYNWRTNSDTRRSQLAARGADTNHGRPAVFSSLRRANRGTTVSDLPEWVPPPSWVAYDESEGERTAQPYESFTNVMRRRRRRGWGMSERAISESCKVSLVYLQHV